MNTDPYHIAQLISKYLCGTITIPEEEILHQWLEESIQNRETFEALKSEQQSQQDLDFFEQLNVDAAWNKLSTQFERKAFTDQKAPRYAGYVAGIALLLFFSWIGWSQLGRPTTDSSIAKITHKRNEILPGSRKAVLLLSNGSSVDLTKGSESVKELDGTTIARKGGEVVYLNKSQNNAKKEIIYNILEVPKAGMYNLTLSDGTKVWVNAMSQLKFPVQFGEKDRRVSLEGEAYFEVAHDKNKPFIVETNGTQVKVLGTHFNVNSYKKVTTTLVEGSVQVTYQKESALLHPGQQAEVSGKISVQKADIKKVIAWKDGDFYFRSDEIVEIMDQISRWYDVSVKYEGTIPQNIGCNGNISRNANLSEVLDILSFATNATFKVDGQEVTVRFVNKPNQ